MNKSAKRAKTAANLPTACGYGLAGGLLAALILLPIATGIAYAQNDPAKMALPAALFALYLSVLCSGVITARKADNPMLAAGICGSIFLLITVIFSLFPIRNATCGFNTSISILTHLAVPAVTLLGALLGKKRIKRPSPHQRGRRRH